MAHESRINKTRNFMSTIALTFFAICFACVVYDYFGWLEHNGYIIYNPLLYAGVKLILPVLRPGPSHASWLRSSADKRRFLGNLPPRRGPAPMLPKWYFPQRHIPQLESAGYRERIEAHMMAAAKANSLLAGRSVREMRGAVAVYSQRAGVDVEREFAHDRLHMHVDDGSVHLSLPPHDAAEVISKGWGMPFILSYWAAARFDAGHVLLYAPRDEQELKVILDIVDAGVEFNLTKLN